MSLRHRMAVLSGLVATVAVIGAITGSYLLTSSEIKAQIDDELELQANIARNLPRDPESAEARERREEAGAELPGPLNEGRVISIRDETGEGRQIAGETQTLPEPTVGGPELQFRDIELEGEPYRMVETELDDGWTVQIARPVAESNRVISNLRFLLGGLGLLGVAAAVVAGRWVGRRVSRPLDRLTTELDEIARSSDLLRRATEDGTGESGRLARSFNVLMERIESSQRALEGAIDDQRQLIADASHELRTPVAALRTNLEMLLEGRMPEKERRELLEDLVLEAEELSAIVADVVAIARDQTEEPGLELGEVRLDLIAAECLGKIRRRYMSTEFAEPVLEPALVVGDAQRIARAVLNLLDNAAKHGSGPIELSVVDTSLIIRDRGPGFDPAELPMIFRRFFRGGGGRRSPGSGLGLAIVSQVAALHGGSVEATNDPGGGAVVCLRLPPVAIASEAEPPAR